MSNEFEEVEGQIAGDVEYDKQCQIATEDLCKASAWLDKNRDEVSALFEGEGFILALQLTSRTIGKILQGNVAMEDSIYSDLGIAIAYGYYKGRTFSQDKVESEVTDKK